MAQASSTRPSMEEARKRAEEVLLPLESAASVRHREDSLCLGFSTRSTGVGSPAKYSATKPR